MKKISLVVLAVCSLLLVACKKPVEQQEDFKVKFEVHYKPIDAVRDYQEGTTDEHCTDLCRPGNGQKTETITPEKSVTKDEEMLLQWHCFTEITENTENNTVSLTLYPKDEPKNKLTFKINFKK